MKTIKLLIVGLVIVSITSCTKQGVTNRTLKTEIDSASYALGLDIADKLKVNFKEVDKELYIQGLTNGLDSTNMLIKKKEVSTILRMFFQKKQEKMIKKQQAETEKKALKKYGDYKKENEEFLVKNKTKKGVKTTKSGLQYIILKEGKGTNIPASGKVKLHYHGLLIDGTVFDSSVEKKKPITHSVTGFVKGFNEGLQLMKQGDKYRFFIPQELAYGAAQRSEKIKPFSTLIFDVEILKIIK